MAQDTIILSANQQRTERISGKFFTVISATNPFTVDLGTGRSIVGVGSQLGTEAFSRIIFLETAGAANTIVFDVSDIRPEGTVPSAAQTNAPSMVFGNLGIPDNTAAAGGLPAVDANGYLRITNGMNLTLPGLNANGQQRQVIIFTMSNAGSSLKIGDPNNNTAIVLQSAAQQSFPLPTASPLVISGVGGTAYVSILEIYLTQKS